MRLLILVAGMLLCFHAIADTDEPIPFEMLFSQSQEYGHTISPDGKKIAILKVESGKTLLSIVGVDDKAIVKKFGLGRGSISQLHWISDYRLAYRWDGSLWSVNSNGTERVRLAAMVYDEKHRKSYTSIRANLKYWNILSTLPESREEILISGYDRKGYETVSRINVFSGEKIDLANGKKYKINKWFVDNNSRVRLAVRTKKGKVETFLVDQGETDKLLLTPIEAGEYGLNFDGSSYVDQKAYFEGFASDNSVYLSERVGRDKFVLSEYSFKENKLIRTIYEDELVDISSNVSNSQLSPIVLDGNNNLLGVRYTNSSHVNIWFDEEMKKIQEKIDRAVPDLTNIITAWDNERKTFVVVHYSDTQPRISSVYSDETSTLSGINLDESDVADYTLSPTEWVTYPARDGTQIPAYITRPLGHSIPSKAVVLPHGGPWARDDENFDPYVQALASRGFLVIQPQFRGSDGFGHNHLIAAKKNLAGIMIDDIADAAKWLITENLAIENKIYAMGMSYGGYAAILSNYRYPELFQGAVSICAPIDLLAQIKFYKKENRDFAYEYWRALVGDPKKEKAILRGISPSYFIKKIQFPLLVIAGEDDSIIDVNQAKEFKEEAEKLKLTNIRVQIFKDEEHGILRPSNQSYMMGEIVEFFDSIKK